MCPLQFHIHNIFMKYNVTFFLLIVLLCTIITCYNVEYIVYYIIVIFKLFQNISNIDLVLNISSPVTQISKHMEKRTLDSKDMSDIILKMKVKSMGWWIENLPHMARDECK